jgi:Nucleotidyltransferase
MSGSRPDPIYVAARRVLLDALDGLAPFRDAIILIGAQAIYLHTGEAGLAVAPYTTDADLALNPEVLLPDPKLDTTMRAAGFAPAPDLVGIWLQAPTHVSVDLLVPESLGGPGRRGARLGPHGNRIARKVRGIEAAMVDNAWMTITALEAGDPRTVQLLVAGPGALLVAKLHKLAERQSSPSRLDDKDALDLYRLLQAIPTELLASALGELSRNQLAGPITQEALRFLQELFGTADAPGSQMAARALDPLEDPRGRRVMRRSGE